MADPLLFEEKFVDRFINSPGTSIDREKNLFLFCSSMFYSYWYFKDDYLSSTYETRNKMGKLGIKHDTCAIYSICEYDSINEIEIALAD